MQSWFVFILRQPLIRLEILSICRKNCYHIFNIFLNIRSACAASKRGMNFYANIFRTTKLSPTDICLYTKPLIHKENGISNEKKKSIAVFLFKNKKILLYRSMVWKLKWNSEGYSSIVETLILPFFLFIKWNLLLNTKNMRKCLLVKKMPFSFFQDIFFSDQKKGAAKPHF